VPLYRRYAASVTFPSLDDAYRRLGIEVVGGSLRFSRGNAGARLREAIAGKREMPESISSE